MYQQLSEPTGSSKAGKPQPSREEILARARQLVEDAATQVRPFFDLWPGKGVCVEPIATELEASQHSTYFPATMDGRRAAVFLINLHQLQMMSHCELKTLCMHETYPGHHVQLTIAQEMDELPLFRRAMLFAAYLEGWAKYSEWFPLAEGLLDEPELMLGRLRSELYSTTNLALDTGLHYLRWTHQEAIRFAQKNTSASEEFARVIVNRSLVAPGQLCAYKTGMMTVMDLHERFRLRRGNSFERRDFHNAILRHGALPLDILEQVVDDSE